MFETLYETSQNHMERSLHLLEKDLAGLRTGRAHPDLLRSVTVEAYGSKMPLDQVSSVSVVDAQLLSLTVWDQSLVSAVEKALQEQNWTPKTEGTVIRIPIPPLSQERRKEMVKMAHKCTEHGKISVRHVRQKAMDKLKKAEKDGEISQDTLHSCQDKIEKLTEQYSQKASVALKQKEKDLLG